MVKLTWHDFTKRGISETRKVLKKDLETKGRFGKSEISPGTGELKTGSEAIRRKEETEAKCSSSFLPVQLLGAMEKGKP